MKDIQYFYEEAKKIHPDLVTLRRHFHMHPELSRQEYKTAEKIESELTNLCVSHQRVGETGVYAEIKGTKEGPDRTIVLRADIDALPIKEEHESPYKSIYDGVMHACGHDSHTANLLGAARLLAENRDRFSGTVRLAFQQAEEIGYGAMVFINQGLIDGADRTFGMHVASNLDVGTIAIVPGPNNASVDWFKIHVHGVSAHVSTPELGVDAAYIAAQILVAVQGIVTRQTNPTESLLIGIGKVVAGTAYNIVASDATMEGTIRAMTPKTRAFAKKQVETIAKSVAASYGGSVDLEWKDFTSPLINDEKSAMEAQKVAKALFGEQNVITSRTPALAGDDFAEFNLRVPGVYCYIGSRNKERPETGLALHNCGVDIDERAILVGSTMYAAYAVAYLNGELD